MGFVINPYVFVSATTLDVLDDFNRADTSPGGLGANWNDPSSSFQIESNHATMLVGGTPTATWATPLGADVWVEATWEGIGANGVIARQATAGGTTFYMARQNTTGGWQLYRCNSGTFTLITSATATIAAGIPYRLRLECVGSSIKVYDVAGAAPGGALTLILSATDTSITSGDYIGVRAINSFDLDDFDGGVQLGEALFGDDFNRADEAIEASANWSINDANGDIVSSQLVMYNGTQFPFVLFDDPGSLLDSADHYAEITVVDGADSTDPIGAGSVNQQVGLVVRWADSSNYYWARFVGAGVNQWQILKVVSGSSTTLTTASETAPAFPFLMRFEVNGTSLKLYVNGVEKLSTTDAALTTGQVGIFAYGSSSAKSYFDTFRAGNT